MRADFDPVLGGSRSEFISMCRKFIQDMYYSKPKHIFPKTSILKLRGIPVKYARDILYQASRSLILPITTHVNKSGDLTITTTVSL
jgi:hypothetical protein